MRRWTKGLGVAVMMSWLLLACGGPRHQAVTLSAAEVRAVRALPAEGRVRLQIDGERTLAADRVAVVEEDTSTARFSPEVPLRTALEEAEAAGDVRLMLLAEPGPAIDVVHAGGYAAIAGGVVAACGVLTMLGAAALGGPAYDHSDWIIGGGVTFVIGTGVAVLGGLTALGGSVAGMKEEGVEDLGAARALAW